MLWIEMCILFLIVEDVIVSEITTGNASVSWTITQFTKPELYYIHYGTDETMQDMMSESIMSSMNTSLMNQTYSTSLENLSPHTAYYLRVAAVFDDIFVRYSDVISFRTYDEGCLINI